MATTTCWGLAFCLGLGQSPPAKDGAASPQNQTEAGSGEPVWQRTVDAQGPASIAVGAAHLFVAADGLGLDALAVADGTVVWSLPVDSPVDLMVADTALLVVEPTRLRALEQDSGAVRWTVSLPSAGSVVSAHSGRVTVGSGRYLLQATLEEGTGVWSRELPTPIRITAAGPDGIAVVLADNSLLVMDPSLGQPHWPTVVVPTEVQAMTIAEGRVYVAGADKTLYGYRAATGRRDWFFPLHASIAGPPVVDRRHVYVALFDNTLRAFDRSSGNRRWWVPLPARPTDGPDLVGQDLFVPLTSGGVSHARASGTGPVRRIPERQAGVADAVRLEAGGVLADGKAVFTLTMGLDRVRTLAVWPRP